MPGGVIEIGESPWQTCRRETKEECGLDVTAGRLVCVDSLHPKPGRPGGMRFLFDCGVFDDAILETVVIQPYEIAESRVVPLATALPLLSGPVRRRVRAACQADQVRYLEWPPGGGDHMLGSGRSTTWGLGSASAPRWRFIGLRRRAKKPGGKPVRQHVMTSVVAYDRT